MEQRAANVVPTQRSPRDPLLITFPITSPFSITSTANLLHTRPSSVQTIARGGDGANHQYDSDDFFAAVKAGNFPAVSFLKAPGYQDGHAGYPIRWMSRPG